MLVDRQGRQWHAGQAGPGAPTGCNMVVAALRLEAMLLRIFARETKHVLLALVEYKDALAVVVIRRRIRGDGAMEWLCFVGEGGGLAGGAPAGQAGHAGNSSLGYCHGFDGKSRAVNNDKFEAVQASSSLTVVAT